MSKKAGILGSGAVAQVLAEGFMANGYEVTLGTQHPEKLEEFKRAHPKASVATFEEAAAFGEIVVLAVKGIIAGSVVTGIKSQLAGKTVIDTTNPISASPPVNGVLRYFTSLDESLMERLQLSAPKANFVKAFNSVGNQYMVNPKINGGVPTMFICGNNEKARKQVTDILEVFGWEVCDLGKAEAARAIEPLCMLWCILPMTGSGRNHAFKLLKD